MDNNRKAADLRVGSQLNWGQDGEVTYGRPLIHVGQHQRRRTKREEANFCAWCVRVIRTGEPKVNVLGYGAAHFHAACFAEWAIAAAAEAGDDVSPFASIAGAIPLLRALRWIERYTKWVAQGAGPFSPQTTPEERLPLMARTIGVWAGNALAQAEAGGRHEAITALQDAAQAALDWFQEAPIAELEAVEDAIEQSAPIAALTKALGTGLVGQVVERYADVARDGYTLEDAVADVLEEVANG